MIAKWNAGLVWLIGARDQHRKRQFTQCAMGHDDQFLGVFPSRFYRRQSFLIEFAGAVAKSKVGTWLISASVGSRALRSLVTSFGNLRAWQIDNLKCRLSFACHRPDKRLMLRRVEGNQRFLGFQQLLRVTNGQSFGIQHFRIVGQLALELGLGLVIFLAHSCQLRAGFFDRFLAVRIGLVRFDALLQGGQRLRDRFDLVVEILGAPQYRGQLWVVDAGAHDGGGERLLDAAGAGQIGDAKRFDVRFDSGGTNFGAVQIGGKRD